jgi:RimJ/RimL family protein N-acetyltransferase
MENLHAMTAWANVKEDMASALTFAEKHRFREKKRLWESRLKPTEADLARFQNYSNKVSREGIRITTLPEAQAAEPDSVRKLYELAQQVSKDVPMAVPYTRTSFEQWKAIEMKNPSMIPEGYFIATDGPRYVGLSTVWRIDKEPKTLNQAMTGVLREYRGRGIAIALKLRVTQYALQNGYETIKTWNDSENAPMLAVNTKLGFKREVGWITMEKNLP